MKRDLERHLQRNRQNHIVNQHEENSYQSPKLTTRSQDKQVLN